MNWKRFGICRERRQNAQKLPGQSSGYLGRSLSLRSLWIWREFATFVRTWCRPVFIVKLWGWEVMAVCCIGEARCAGGSGSSVVLWFFARWLSYLKYLRPNVNADKYCFLRKLKHILYKCLMFQTHVSIELQTRIEFVSASSQSETSNVP